MLTVMLSDRWLSLNHDTMEDLLIKANHQVWSEIERDNIIDAALQHFMQKHHKRQLDSTSSSDLGVPPKELKLGSLNETKEDSDSDTGSRPRCSDGEYEWS